MQNHFSFLSVEPSERYAHLLDTKAFTFYVTTLLCMYYAEKKPYIESGPIKNYIRLISEALVQYVFLNHIISYYEISRSFRVQEQRGGSRKLEKNSDASVIFFNQTLLHI